jgi:thiazole synthase
MLHSDPFTIGGKVFSSRLFLGTGKYSSDNLIPAIVSAAGCEIMTVAVRRFDIGNGGDDILDRIPAGIGLMPNTSGARNAGEAVRIAELGRAATGSDWVKIEVISDHRRLLPDGLETIKAAEILVKKGFHVFPYINPDLYIARALRDAGCSAIMPLGAPIGSGRGLRTGEMIGILIEEIDLPVIVDAGIGRPSEACLSMEMGAAACLVNTAVALADDPVTMAGAFRLAVRSGRAGYLAGLVSPSAARASSPLTGFLDDAV